VKSAARGNDPLRVTMLFPSAPAADQSDDQPQTAEAEYLRCTASRLLPEAKNQEALEKSQHVSSNHSFSVQPESQRNVSLND
jgi:hypothetical protein